MDAATFFANFETIAEAPGGVAKLRELILELAVRGKLVPQDPSDEPASELLTRIAKEKARSGAKEKPSPELAVSEPPFDLPPQWSWARLGDLVLHIDSGWSPACLDRGREGEEWGVLKVSAVSWGDFLPEENKALPPGVEARPQHEVHDGDYLMSRANTADLVGRSVIARQPPPRLMMSDKLLRVRFSGQVDINYMNLFNNGSVAREHYRKHSSGTSSSMRNISREKISLMPITVPPIAEQRRIVTRVGELLERCDRYETSQTSQRRVRGRLHTSSINALTTADTPNALATAWARLRDQWEIYTSDEDSIDQLRQAILQLAVQGKLVPQTPTDQPAIKLLKGNAPLARVSSKALPMSYLPEGWYSVRLAELGSFVGGGTPAKDKVSYWGGAIPWVSPKDMKRPIISDSQDSISDKALEETAVKLIPTGALLMVTRGMILAHSFPVALTAREVTINQDMKALVLDDPSLGRFLLLALQAGRERMLKEVLRSSHGTCRIESDAIASFEIALPPRAEQARILAKVEELSYLCAQLKDQVRRQWDLGSQFSSSSVQALTG